MKLYYHKTDGGAEYLNWRVALRLLTIREGVLT